MIIFVQHTSMLSHFAGLQLKQWWQVRQIQISKAKYLPTGCQLTRRRSAHDNQRRMRPQSSVCHFSKSDTVTQFDI